jgi:hypothetical protein
MHPRSKHLFIFFVALVLLLILASIFGVRREAPRGASLHENSLLFATPQDMYAVEHANIQNNDKERDAFIEKVRATLPPEPEVLSTPPELTAEPELVLPVEEKPTVAVATSTQTSVIPATTTTGDIGTSTSETYGDTSI